MSSVTSAFVENSKKRASYKSVDILQQLVMRLHGMRQPVHGKPVASCEQICRKLVLPTCYQQASCNSFRQIVTSLHVTSCNKPDLSISSLIKLKSLLQLVEWQQQTGRIDNFQRGSVMKNSLSSLDLSRTSCQNRPAKCF